MPKKVYEKPTVRELVTLTEGVKRAFDRSPVDKWRDVIILDDRTNPDELDEPIPFALGNGTVLP